MCINIMCKNIKLYIKFQCINIKCKNGVLKKIFRLLPMVTVYQHQY